MRPFNLARAKLTERTYSRMHVNRGLRAIFLLVAAMLVCFAGTGYVQVRSSAKARVLNAHLARLQARCKVAQSMVERNEKKTLVRAWQKQLAGATTRKLNLLYSIVECAPQDLWISRVTTGDGQAVVSIEGSAATYGTLAQFTADLRTKREFGEVRLNSAKATSAGQSQSVEFAIEVDVKSQETASVAPSQTPPTGGGG
jgi:Tfp pilus assembly protein PilN